MTWGADIERGRLVVVPCRRCRCSSTCETSASGSGNSTNSSVRRWLRAGGILGGLRLDLPRGLGDKKPVGSGPGFGSVSKLSENLRRMDCTPEKMGFSNKHNWFSDALLEWAGIRQLAAGMACEGNQIFA
jgi:hypothetical protein